MKSFKANLLFILFPLLLLTAPLPARAQFDDDPQIRLQRLSDRVLVLTEDSPKTDENYSADPAYPNWIWEVWYEVWVDWKVYGGEDPGKVYITGIHAANRILAGPEIATATSPAPQTIGR